MSQVLKQWLSSLGLAPRPTQQRIFISYRRRDSSGYAGRVADYLDFAEVLTLDALERTESCGGHFREESQTPDGEALRDDDNFSYVAAWEFQGVGKIPTLHKEQLTFEYVKPTQRSYK